MTFKTTSWFTLKRVRNHWQLLVVAVVMLGMCSCRTAQPNSLASPQTNRRLQALRTDYPQQLAGGRPSRQDRVMGSARRPAEPNHGKPGVTALPSPAPLSALGQRQRLAAQQRLMQQQMTMRRAAQQPPQSRRMAVPRQLQQQRHNSPAVMPASFEGSVSDPAVAEMVSTSYPAPCTAPYCLPPGGSPANYGLNHSPKYYLPGPDAPNLGGWRDDEFLCDGGDKDVKVVIGKDWSVYGLNLEDTVGHYDTLDGKRIVEPSNCVCIYAPRFAAVRQVRGVSMNKQRTKSAGVEQPEQLVQQDELQIASTKIQQIQPLGELGRNRTVTLEEDTRGLTVDNTLLPGEFANRFANYENFQVIRIGIHQQSEEAVLAESIEAAAVWETKQAVQVLIDKQRVQIQKGLSAAQELDHFEERGAPKMRVIKVASTKYASPGDEIEFTIRFDNIGDEKIGNVTIIDNLTTRLEYVPDSAQCNVKADFLTQVNEGDSLILRWEIINPLDPGKGGIIRFKCRVR